MFRSLFEEFKRLKGQPVEIFTTDGRIIIGKVLMVFEDAVRVIDKCNRIILIEFRQIDAVVEPQMDLEPCCDEDFDEDEEDDRDDREDEDEDEDDECHHNHHKRHR